MTRISRDFRRTQVPACLALAAVVLTPAAGCAHAAPPADPTPAHVRSHAAFGAAMLNIYEAQRLEFTVPAEALERWKEALVLLERAHRSDPAEPEIMQIMIAACVRLGRLDRAADLCAALIDAGKMDTAVFDHVVATLIRVRSYDRAVALLQAAIAKQEDLDAPFARTALERLTPLYQMAKMSEKGVAFVAELRKRARQSVPLCRAHIVLLFDLGRNDEAEKEADAFLRDHPDADAVRFLRVDLYRKSGRRDEMAADIRRVLAAPDRTADARMIGAHAALQYALDARTPVERRTALDLLSLALQGADNDFPPRLLAELRLQAARCHLREKQFDRAEALLSALSQAGLSSWRIQATAADIKWSQGKRDLAVADLKGAVAALPKGDDARRLRMVLADYLDRMGNYEEAVATVRQNLEEQSDDPSSNNHLGYLFAVQGKNLDEAEKLVRKALEAEPDTGAYLDSLAWVYYKMALRDDDPARLGAAAEIMARAVKQEPDDPVINDHAGDIAFVEGRLKMALDRWEAALVLSEEGEDVPDRGLLQRKVKEARQAIESSGAPTRPIVRPLKPPSPAD